MLDGPREPSLPPDGPPRAAADTLELVVLAGTSNPSLARSLARELGVALGDCTVERFPDGEMHVRVGEDVRGAEVVVVQSTGSPAGENVLELLLVADACWRSGADRMTALIPYFGYARQDRRKREGEPLGARVVADVLGQGGFYRIIAVELHSATLEGFFPARIEHLTAEPLLVQSVRAHAGEDSVIVSPDLGAVKLAEMYAQRLGLPLAIVSKMRLSGTEVRVAGVVGHVRGLRPVIIDDMISTGGTIRAAATALLHEGCVPDITVVTTHALLVGRAVETLASIPVARLVTTNSLPVTAPLPFANEIVDLAPLLAEAIQRLRQGAPADGAR